MENAASASDDIQASSQLARDMLESNLRLPEGYSKNRLNIPAVCKLRRLKFVSYMKQAYISYACVEYCHDNPNVYDMHGTIKYRGPAIAAFPMTKI